MSVMMIKTSVFEKMCSRFEGAMGLQCNRGTGRQMQKKSSFAHNGLMTVLGLTNNQGYDGTHGEHPLQEQRQNTASTRRKHTARNL